MRSRPLTLVVTAAVTAASLLGACGDDDGSTGATVPGGSPSPAESTAAETPPTSLVPPVTTAAGSPREEAAVADLAERLGVDHEAILVVDARDVTWPDGSLGCPQPGMNYIQVLTEGYLVVLEADGQRYEYHGGADGPLTFCTDPQPPTAG